MSNETELAVTAERDRCAEIFRDAAEKLACYHASQGLLPVSEIGSRSSAWRDAFLKVAQSAAEKANTEKS